jgi:hypothetical protein
MTIALATTIVGYLIEYGPTGYKIVTELIDGVRNLSADGHVPTDEELAALTQRIVDQHNNLPVPE